MKDLKKWAGKYKELCVLTGIFGLLLSPFLWPLFLAIVLNSLTIAIPVLLVVIMVKQPWKEKKENEKERCCKQSGNGAKCCEQQVSEFDAATNQAETTENSLSKGQKERVQPLKAKPCVTTDTGRTEKGSLDEDTNLARSWYRMEGRERILLLANKMKREHIYSFSISREGICTVKEQARFRRIGVLRDFPKNRMEIIRQELQKEGIQSHIANGKYLWISWKNQEVR